MTEIAVYQPQTSLTEQMEFARAVVARPEGGARSLLPDSYRDNPGNVLIAVGLGSSMGLSPAESLYRIDVIQGKPTAGAELIAANVRKAGHKLRVQGDETSATATIIRADDPDFPFTVTRDLEWARKMGLTNKDNYKKQPGTMLQWRAITAVARLACPEALYGVAYTADEMFDDGGRPEASRSGGGGLGAALANPGPTVSAEHVPQTSAPEGAPDDSSASVSEPATSGAEPLSKRTRGHLFALFAQKGIAEDDQLAGANHILGTAYESRSEFTEDDALRLISVLDTKPDVDTPLDAS